METKWQSVVVMMVLLPGTVFGATDCKIIDFPDHYEAVCVGDEKPGTVQAHTAARVHPNMMNRAAGRAQTNVSAQTDADKMFVERGLNQRPNQPDLKEAKAANEQTTVTAQANADTALIVRKMNRRPKQADLVEAKAARLKLVQEELQKEPDTIAVAAPMQD